MPSHNTPQTKQRVSLSSGSPEFTWPDGKVLPVMLSPLLTPTGKGAHPHAPLFHQPGDQAPPGCRAISFTPNTCGCVHCIGSIFEACMLQIFGQFIILPAWWLRRERSFEGAICREPASRRDARLGYSRQSAT